MACMPDLFALHHVDYVIMMTPKVFKPAFDPTVIAGEKGVTNGQSFATTGIIRYMGINVVQSPRFKKVYTC